MIKQNIIALSENDLGKIVGGDDIKNLQDERVLLSYDFKHGFKRSTIDYLNYMRLGLLPGRNRPFRGHAAGAVLLLSSAISIGVAGTLYVQKLVKQPHKKISSN